jgi:hypothetical protein
VRYVDVDVVDDDDRDLHFIQLYTRADHHLAQPPDLDTQYKGRPLALFCAT